MNENIFPYTMKCAIINSRCYHNGRRLALYGGTVTLRNNRNLAWLEILLEGGSLMTIDTLLAVLGFGATMFGIGYMIGQNHSNKNSNDRQA